MMQSAVIKAYRSLIEYIMKCRAETENASLYVELEALAHRWGSYNDF
jgi:hypothetical protein